MAERPEEPEATVDSTPGQPSPAAMALALGRTSRGKGAKALDTEAEGFLRDQRRLINLQTEHLHEQRALVLSRLRWGRYSDRMKALLQTLGVALGAAIVIGFGVLAWRARADQGLLVETFSAPPSFAQQGVSGEVVAADIVSKLSAIVAVARSNSLASTNGARQDASDDVKIEIPETGVSLTEVWRAMRDWLGSERRVTGAVRESAGNAITLTASLGGGQVFTVTGASADLDRLEQQLAEKLYAATDPINVVVYFVVKGRKADALAAAARNVVAARGREDRATALDLWAVPLSDPNRVLRLARIAVGIDPLLLASHDLISRADLDLGHDEAALAELRRMLTLKDADQPVQNRGAGSAQSRAYAKVRIKALTGDFTGAVHDWLAPSGSDGFYGPLAALLLAADADARAHDPSLATALLVEVTAAATPSPNNLLTIRYDIDAARGDWTAALGDAQALNAADDKAAATSTDPDEKAGLVTAAQVRYRPLLAEAGAHAGNTAGAAATISGTPLDCYDCLRLRGRVAALSGDAAAAARWFAETVRQGPSLPFAYADWGQMLLTRGDFDGAIAKLTLAHAIGPHFADPLELWGEALMAKRDYTDAIKKFAEADKDAPKWGRNHLCWGEALMLSGRYAEARAQFETANGLDLSKPGRAALNVLLARTSSGPLHG